ncbi:hypothetical protein [Lacticaseibacillus saniviri]|uniref:DnaD domain-containing protein n=1 Tax=Lacticaseibacillus saniviri JCM 17471 = DSM 24301 TaxID=1293598 RepID=A0A0R2MRG3_9LACO|nr:hypothetical protein [Lacticaseibacillus saniviri]KRO16190.1 hypothetical protein IV56_GL001906 [Lacticaseibacillus saniviri JCM 17471 = DSM 24301]
MDYFKQRRAFRKLLTEELDLSLGQVSLYRELLDYANDESKMDVQFKLRNSILASRTGLTEEGVKSARNRLVQENLITYVPGKKNKSNPAYQLVKLYVDHPSQRASSTSTSLPATPQPAPQPTPQSTPHKYLLRHDYDLTKKTSRPKSDKRTFEPGDPNLQAAEYLWGFIKGNNPEAKHPNLQRWANDIRLMHERDKRTYEQINGMIVWSQKDEFWQANILSAGKLRQKYDAMRAKANAASKAKPKSYGKPKRVEARPDWLAPNYQPPKEEVTPEMEAQLAANQAKLAALRHKNSKEEDEHVGS